MTLRARLTLVAAGVVAVVVALASATTYFVMRHELQSQLDGSLHSAARSVQLNPDSSLRGPEEFGGNLVEVVDAQGSYVNGTPGLHLLVDRSVLGVAGHRSHAFYRDINATGRGGVEYELRELVAPLGFPLGAVLVVKNLQETNRALER